MKLPGFAKSLLTRAPLLSRLLKGAFWNGVSLALNQGGTLAASVVVARMLGPERFGQYAIVLSTVMSVATLAQTGLAYAATKYIAEFRSVDQARTGRIAGLCTILGPALAAGVAVVLAVAAPFAAGPVLGSKDLALPLAVGAVFVLASAANSYQVGALTGLERYRALAVPAGVCALTTAGCVAAGVKLGGVTGAVAGLSLATGLRWWLHQRALRKECREAGIDLSPSGAWTEVPLLYGFALPAALSSYLMIPGLWVTNAWLVRQPGGYSQLAQFAAAQTIRLTVMFVPLLLNSVGLSVLNNVRRESAESYASVHRMNRIALTGVTAALALLMGAGGTFLLRIFGSGFVSTGNAVLWILLGSAVVESALLGTFQAIQAEGRMWMALVTIAIPWQAAFVASAFFLIPRFGAVGLAAASLLGISVGFVTATLSSASISRNAVSRKSGKRKTSMSPFDMFRELSRFTRWARTQYLVRKDPVAYARTLGVTIGEGSHIYDNHTGVFGSEPYLVSIGNNCHIAHDVRFITHDGMAIVLRGRHPDIDLVERIEVGNNVAIGMRSIILPGVRIGSNCIIGCASVVNRDVPDNTIVAGVPARVIGSLEDYERKVVGRSIHTGTLYGPEKERRIREIFAVGQPGGR